MFAFGQRFAAAWAVILIAACSSPAPSVIDTGGGGGGSTGGEDPGGGGGTGGGDPPPPTTALFVATAAEKLDYQTLFKPAVTAMVSSAVVDGNPTMLSILPSGGSVDYLGFIELLIGGSAASANVAAPITLSLGFDSLAMTGSATGFMGTAIDENLEEQLVNYAGTIQISDGLVSVGTGGTAAVSLDVDGSLDSGLHVFGVDGTLVGYLFGPAGEGLRVRGSNTSIDGSMVTTIDGAAGLIGVGTISAMAAPTTP